MKTSTIILLLAVILVLGGVFIVWRNLTGERPLTDRGNGIPTITPPVENGIDNRSRSMAEVLGDSEDFKIFDAAIRATGIRNLLETGGPYTLFAPRDSFLENLSRQEIENLLRESRSAEAIVRNHIINDRIEQSELIEGRTLRTLDGKSLTVQIINGETRINNVRVSEPAIEVENGFIYPIDNVLLPR